MNSELWATWIGMRGRDLNAIVLPFVLSHTGIMAMLVFGGDGLESSGVKLAVAAWAVLGSLWAAVWFDGAIEDIAAGAKDMDPQIAETHMGKVFAKAPFTFFRIFNVTVITLIVTAELMALYN